MQVYLVKGGEERGMNGREMEQSVCVQENFHVSETRGCNLFIYFVCLLT